MRGNRVLVNIQRIAARCGLHDPDSPRTEDQINVKSFRYFFTYYFTESGMDKDFVDELRGDKRTASRDEYHDIRTNRLIFVYRSHAPHLNIKIRKTNKLLF
jgi:Site-specific recombinase XerD